MRIARSIGASLASSSEWLFSKQPLDEGPEAVQPTQLVSVLGAPRFARILVVVVVGHEICRKRRWRCQLCDYFTSQGNESLLQKILGIELKRWQLYRATNERPLYLVGGARPELANRVPSTRSCSIWCAILRVRLGWLGASDQQTALANQPAPCWFEKGHNHISGRSNSTAKQTKYHIKPSRIFDFYLDLGLGVIVLLGQVYNKQI